MITIGELETLFSCRADKNMPVLVKVNGEFYELQLVGWDNDNFILSPSSTPVRK